MKRERLLVGVAAVLAGIATVEFVLGFVYTPVFFAVAVPFAAAAYLLWYHVSGRLRDRVERGRAGSYRRADDRRAAGRGPDGGRGADATRSGTGRGADSRWGADANRGADAGRRTNADRGGFGAGPRDSYSGRRGGFGPRDGGRRSRAGRARGVRGNAGPTPREAYRVLGLDPDADHEEVRRAYRERVKAVHPDREGGDEAEFKRVKEAYEVLQDRN